VSYIEVVDLQKNSGAVFLTKGVALSVYLKKKTYIRLLVLFW